MRTEIPTKLVQQSAVGCIRSDFCFIVQTLGDASCALFLKAAVQTSEVV